MTRPVPLLLLLAGLLFFFALGNHQLQGSTEARVAGIAMAMHLDNDWVVPQLFREPFLEKPPLSLWLDAGAIRLFGGTPGAVRLASAFAGLFSVMLDPRFTQAEVDAFCDAQRLFKLGYSWGGPISLVVPYELETMRSGWPEHLLRGTLVRFSVGLEDVADLQADIAQALEVLR